MSKMSKRKVRRSVSPLVTVIVLIVVLAVIAILYLRGSRQSVDLFSKEAYMRNRMAISGLTREQAEEEMRKMVADGSWERVKVLFRGKPGATPPPPPGGYRTPPGPK